MTGNSIITNFASRIAAILICLPATTALPQTNSPVETAFQELLVKDEAAQRQLDQLLANNEAFARQGAGLSEGLLKTKVHQLVDPVIESYEAFLKQHQKFVKAHLAYASFLLELNQTKEAGQHLRTAHQLEPANPIVLNNLANFQGQFGPASEAFLNYERAIKAKPDESTYLRNYASVLLVNRDAARKHLGAASDEAVYAKALELFKKARALAPEDFLLASTLAQTYYQIKPLPYSEATQAWEDALKLARTSLEKQGVMIHIARLHIDTKNYDEARRNLNSITDPSLDSIRKPLLAKIPIRMTPLPFSSSTRGPSLFNFSTAPPPGK